MMKKILTLTLFFIMYLQAYSQPKRTYFHNLYVQKDTAALFTGLPNPIDIHIPHVKARNIKLKCSDTDIVIYPSMAHGDTMAFVIYAHTSKNSEVFDMIVGNKTYKTRFAVCPPPALALHLGNIKYNSATTKDIIAQDQLRICFADPVWGANYHSDVIEYVLVTNSNGNIMNLQGVGSGLTDGMKDLIKTLPPNAIVSFEQVIRTYPPYDLGNAPESLKIIINDMKY